MFLRGFVGYRRTAQIAFNSRSVYPLVICGRAVLKPLKKSITPRSLNRGYGFFKKKVDRMFAVILKEQ